MIRAKIEHDNQAFAALLHAKPRPIVPNQFNCVQNVSPVLKPYSSGQKRLHPPPSAKAQTQQDEPQTLLSRSVSFSTAGKSEK